jgi:hypothetical protein
MLVKIIRSRSVIINGDTKELKAGETIALPADKSQRLIDAGYAELLKPDIEEYHRLTKELADRDPKGDCWDWIIKNLPDIWREHLSAFYSGNITEARETFDKMIAAWRGQQL